MLIRLFRGAGATGHVFFLKNGRTRDKGLAYSGFHGPRTTIAVVPTTPQILDFAVKARTSDRQNVTVTGNIKVSLVPARAVSRFDFTVGEVGAYLNPWDQSLRAIVIEQVLAPIHDQANALAVEAATQAHKAFEDAVTRAVVAAAALGDKGVDVDSCSVVRIEADDKEVEQAIGARERQAMLTEADRALHDRRLKAAENERAVKTYEAETTLKLEEARAQLLEQQGENKKKEAEADAEATRARLAPFNDAEAGRVLGAALMKMAEGGRIANLSIVPEMLAALQQR
jgi:hypothetical protein